MSTCATRSVRVLQFYPLVHLIVTCQLVGFLASNSTV